MQRKITYFLSSLFGIISILISTLTYGQVSYSDLDLKYGNHEVGFTHIQLIDSTRVYEKKMNYDGVLNYRPIDISIWYPAKGTSDQLIQINDYLEIFKNEQEWANLPDEFILEWFGYYNSEQSQKNKVLYSKSTRKAIKKEGQYPLIIYCPSYQAPSIENFILCEYLTSHGFIVISASGRGPFSINLNGGTIQDAEAQSRDIEFIIGYAQNLEQVDIHSKYLVGFSFGGLSNVLVPIRNQSINGVISLDGTIKYKLEELEKSSWFDLNRFSIPFIHFSQKNIPEEVIKEQGFDQSINTAFDFFERLNSTKYEFRMNDLTHGYFSSLGTLFYPRDDKQDKSYASIAHSYTALCKTTLSSIQYMDHVERENQLWNQQEFLEALELDRSTELIAYDIHKKKPNLFLYHVEQSRKEEYKNLNIMYQQIKLEHKDYKPHEGDLNTLGLQLIFSPSTFKLGERIFKFALNLYPNSANLFDSLAEGYRVNGKDELAIKYFKRSLELYPQNNNAIRRLKIYEEMDKSDK